MAERPADVRFGSKAEVKALNIDVRFTPESGHHSDIERCLLSAKSGLMQCSNFSALFDHLVSAHEERLGNFQPERLRGLEIDDQLEFRRLQQGDRPAFRP